MLRAHFVLSAGQELRSPRPLLLQKNLDVLETGAHMDTNL